jgi:hypothetical protein
MEGVHENVTPGARPRDELRARMFRILDEIATARAERTKALSAEFQALWDEIGREEVPTVH